MLQYQIQDVVVVVNYINVIKPYHIQLFNWVIQAHQATNVLLYNNGLPVQQNTSCAFKMAGGYVWDSKKKDYVQRCRSISGTQMKEYLKLSQEVNDIKHQLVQWVNSGTMEIPTQETPNVNMILSLDCEDYEVPT